MNTALLDEAKRLPLAERIELAETLWDSIYAPIDAGGETPEWHRQLLEQRLAEYRKNPHEGSPWRDVLARLEAQ